MSRPVEPEPPIATGHTPAAVQAALMQTARESYAGHLVIALCTAVLSAIALVLSLWNVGARAPIDLPVLCIAIAFAVATLALLVGVRARIAAIAGLSARNLIGVTQNRDKSLWLHFQDGRTLRVPSPSISPAQIEAALPSRPAPPREIARPAIGWALALAPLGVGLWLNEAPIPAKIAQIDSTRGTVELRGTARLAKTALLQIGKSPPYATLILDDGSGKREIMVEADAMSDDVVERARQGSGVAVRVVVHHKKTRFKGVGTAEIDVLIADWFDPLGSDQKAGR